jgi:hypothetical protein
MFLVDVAQTSLKEKKKRENRERRGGRESKN